MVELLQELNGISLSPTMLLFIAMYLGHDNRIVKLETKVSK
ncbi:hypothetical protein [Vibrio sp. CyArs1]|nr:hypothetical protein [Vibrio sp. CyArs1]